MKTQDIKNMASAYMQVLEKAKMDKVNPKALEKDFDDREDKDIDNDGDTDKSDEYLHNRRKAVKNAMKKEEVDLDEAFKIGDKVTYQKSKKERGNAVISSISTTKKNHFYLKTEKEGTIMVPGGELELQESMKKEAVSNMGKKPSDTQMGTVTVTTDAERAKRAQAYRDKQASMKKEEVEELDEISRDTARSYIRKASAHKTTGETPKKDRSSGVELAGKKAYGIGGKAKVMATEEVEELDELSKKTLGSYIKKATSDAMTKSFKAGDVRDKDSTNNRLKAMGRQMGIAKATNKLTSEAKDGDGANIVRDREFKEPKFKFKSHPYGSPEWHANKAAHEKFKAQQAAKKAMKKEEVDLDEAAPKMKSDFIKTQREKDRAHDDAMGRAPTGRKKTMTSTQRSMASMRKEDTDMSMREKLQLQKESILEKEMTDAEMKKREDIVKGMKKNKADLEKRYGSRWKDVMYATATKQAMESVDNALAMTKNLLTTKESFNTETTTWPVYARIKENRAMQTKGATPPETMDDKMTASDKAFIAPHGSLNGVDSGIDGEKAAEYTAKNATNGIKPGGGMNRPGDNKTGDKNIIKSTEAK